MRNATRFGALAAVTVVAAGLARADGTVELIGDRATVVGRVGPKGVIEVGRSLGFLIPQGRHGPVRGRWVRVEGVVLPTSRRDGDRTVLRLAPESLQVIAVETPEDEEVRPGLSDVVDGAALEEEQLARLFERCRVTHGPGALEAFVRRVASATPEARRRWAARLGELTALPPDPVDGLRAVIDAALVDGVLDRDEWAACRTLWAVVDLHEAHAKAAARLLATGDAPRRTLLAGLRADLPFEVVAVLLGQGSKLDESTMSRDANEINDGGDRPETGESFVTRSGKRVVNGRYVTGPEAGQPWNPVVDPR